MVQQVRLLFLVVTKPYRLQTNDVLSITIKASTQASGDFNTTTGVRQVNRRQDYILMVSLLMMMETLIPYSWRVECYRHTLG
jgi:protein involved in polysaccharide export with SLBB domain